MRKRWMIRAWNTYTNTELTFGGAFPLTFRTRRGATQAFRYCQRDARDSDLTYTVERIP